MRWFQKHHKDSEAKQAVEEANESLEQADRDLRMAEYKLLDSQRVTERLREHNLANHYDDWLSKQFLKYYKP